MINGSEQWNEYMPYEIITETLESGRQIETFPGIPANLYDAVCRRAERMPEKTAVSDSFGHSFSYRQLKEETDRFAAVLYERYHVRKGSHIAMMMYSSCEFAVAFLAAVRLGAVAVMLPTKYRKKEICALSDRADLTHVICDTDYRSYFEKYQNSGIAFLFYHSSKAGYAFAEETDGMPAAGPAHVPPADPEDVCVMMFTSGTTTLSKGVMIENYSFMHAVAAYQQIFEVTPSDSTVIPVPIYMITGLAALFGMMLYAGGTVYLQQFFRAGEVLACVRDRGVTFLHAAGQLPIFYV